MYSKLISNKMQLYAVYLYPETALHVSGDTSTHHQERTQLYLQHLVFVTPYCYLPLSRRSWNSSISSMTAAGSNNDVTNTRCCNTVLCAPDDGWRYHPKHVEQFPDINKLCKVASCWIYIGIPCSYLCLLVQPHIFLLVCISFAG